MKKRIVCFVLTLIMLIGLVPVSALPAAAASNAISEKAITVLKNLEGGYSKYCVNGYIGYGEKCPECNGINRVDCDYKSTPISEKQADKNLRATLKDLDKAVNKFADKNGLSLSQSQHDALVIFSFENGTAWTMGTGEFQTAIKSGYTGSKFLDAICKWEYSTLDDNRRMVEANMYLNGVYSSERPSRYIRVTMNPDPDGSELGYLLQDNEAHLHYFDVITPVTITLAATPYSSTNTFLGWYRVDSDGDYVRVTTLTNLHHTKELFARYQNEDDKAGERYDDILYSINKSGLASTKVYNKPDGTVVTTYIDNANGGKEVTIKLPDVLYVFNDYIDGKGNHWAYVGEIVEKDDGTEVYNYFGWVKTKSAGSSTSSGTGMDVTVTVTNTYVNMRKNASITSTKNGSFNMGDKLRIIDTKNGSDGFLWGQVAASESDDTAIGWVALMYTDYDSVLASSQSAAPESSIATATINYNGYVNVRSDAGVNNQIVGALSYGVTVELYEMKYVNGIRWGRCSTGWFCLSYATVVGMQSGTGTNDAGFTNYIYVVKLDNWEKNMTVNDGAYEFFYTPGGSNKIDDAFEKDSKGEYVLDNSGNKIPVKITSNQLKIQSLRAYTNGDTIETWAYTPYGWLKINEHSKSATELSSDGMIGISFEAKYYAIGEDVTVRTAPKSSASRVNILIKGVEFNVHEIVMVDESIWGYAEKEGRVYDKTTGEETVATYEGWINLSNQNVSRNASDDYNIEDTTSNAGTTVKMARVVGTDSLRVRNTGASYGTVIGSLSMGTTAVVLDEKDGWYLLDIDVDNNPATGSWCSGAYLEIYDDVQGGSSNSGSSTGAVETGLGMVANTYTGVNVRTGAGTAYPLVNKLLTGTTVEILEVKTVGAAKWGRTAQGWVCMDYIVMVDKYQTGLNGGSTGSNATTSSNVVIYTGEITNDNVIVYSNTNTQSDDTTTGVGDSIPVGTTVRVLNSGDPVTVHELIMQVEYDEPDEDQTVDDNDGKDEVIVKRTTYWARINEGYIYAPGDNIALYALDEHVYSVAVAETDVYHDSDLSSEKDFDFAKGTKLYVTQLQIIRNEVACFAEDANSLKEGWVPLSNLDKGFASSAETEPEETEPENNNSGSNTNTGTGTVIGSTGNTGGSVSASGYKYTGKVINTNQVNVRATASTTANVTTTLKNGASLVIYETVISEYMAWGRCDSGWIYLYYVDLTPVGSGAVDARVVYNDNTVIYKDMGMTEATGSTYAKMAVVDIYEIVGKMARTEMGWIHMDNLL